MASIRVQRVLFFRFILVFLLFRKAASAMSLCLNDTECEHLQGVSSKCVDSICSNPFEQGCLHSLLPNRKKRVCNSDDPPDAEKLGVCRKPPIDYMEVRIFSQSWESSIFASWCMQILLSEMLDVPTTIETGTPDAKVSFYDSRGSFQFGTQQDQLSLEGATELGDCRLASRQADNYKSCAHILPECWDASLSWVTDRVQSGQFERPEALGVLGQEAWFVPKFTAIRDPSIMASCLSTTRRW
jgi:hypothetical protein